MCAYDQLKAAFETARSDVATVEVRIVELMRHRSLLRQSGKQVARSDETLARLEGELADMRAEQEFARQRLKFRTPRR